jgi:hypothetical protein
MERHNGSKTSKSVCGAEGLQSVVCWTGLGTFEGSHLPGLGFGQALLAGVRGQRQRHTTASQQEAHLLAARVLEGRTRRRALGRLWAELPPGTNVPHGHEDTQYREEVGETQGLEIVRDVTR